MTHFWNRWTIAEDVMCRIRALLRISFVFTVIAASLFGFGTQTNRAQAANKAQDSAEDVSGQTKAGSRDGKDAVERGRYIAVLGDCAGCHTNPGGQPLAGGQKIETPFGPLYSPNLTPDPDTGLGNWTYADFERALRQGMSRDHSPLYPAMPYMYYTKVTDRDLQDLWAYIKSVNPVHNKVQEGTVQFPFNIEAGLSVWQDMFFEPGRFQANADRSETWNRGAYLVQGLTHCGSCHTPRNALYASEKEHELTGGTIPGQAWYAQDISTGPRSRIADWTVPQLVTYLKTGVKDGEVAVGPMREVIHDSLSKVKESDLKAIAEYLKDSGVPSAFPTPRAFQELPQSAFQSGKAVYAANCEGCHGADGRGVAGAAPDLRNTIEAAEPYNAIAVVLQGVEASKDYPRMASFADALDNQQVADVVNYIRRAWSPYEHPVLATPSTVGALRTAVSIPASAEQPIACWHAGDDILGAEMRERLGALPAGDFKPEQVRDIVAEYQRRHPDASTRQSINALVSGYCTGLQRENVNRSKLLASEFAFSAAVTRELLKTADK